MHPSSSQLNENLQTINTPINSDVSNYSVATSTKTTIKSITFSKGIYIVSCTIQFNSGLTTGNVRTMYFADSESAGIGYENCVKVPGGATYIIISRTYLLNIIANTTYYLMAQHDCGETIGVNGRIQYIQIS